MIHTQLWMDDDQQRAPQSPSLPALSPSEYAIILHKHKDVSVSVSSIGSRPCAKASLVKITRLKLGEQFSYLSLAGQQQAPTNDRTKLLFCIYQGTDADLDISTTPGKDPSYEGRYSQLSEILYGSNPPPKCALFAPEDESPESPCDTFDVKGEIPPDCIYSLQRAISAWHSRKFPNRLRGKNERQISIPRRDVEHLTNIFSPYVKNMNSQQMAESIMTALGLDYDMDYLKESRRRYRSNTRQLPQYKNLQDTLRLAMAECIENQKTVVKDETRVDGIRSQKAPPQPLRSSSGLVAFLPSWKKTPLISITLDPKEADTTASNSVISDALLRACIKRLLVGRILLHSEVRTCGKLKENKSSPSDTTMTFRTCLSVKVPQNTPPHNQSQYKRLRFQVVDVQSSEVIDTQITTIFVILPSTRIIFQAHQEEGKPLRTENEPQQPKPVMQIPSLPPHKPHGPIPPHQHLLESLRSMIFFQPNHSRPLPIPRSFLFSGPPGVGKTFSVKRAISIANSWYSNPTATHTESNDDAVHLVSLRGSEILATSSSSGGNNATAARELERQFQVASNLCRITASNRGAKAVVIFLDECDALVSSSVVAAMLAAILDNMEGGVDSNKCRNGWERVLLVAATNRVDAIPGFLRRPGRLEKEVVVSPPTIDERVALLKTMLGSSGSTTTSMSKSYVGIDQSSLMHVAEACVGYVAADLSALVRRAAILGMERQFHDKSNPIQLSLTDCPLITVGELFSAMNDVGASCLRDASLSAPPKTTWSDIAGDAGGAKRALREAIEWPRTRRAAFKALGLSPPRGVLLHGPPGCAKTTLARAAAGAAGVAFLSLSPADVYASSYVGEAEGVVRRAFDLARSAAPCVLFFDEIDAIIGGEDEVGNGNKGHGMGRGSSAEARVLSTFLNEMDGIDGSVEDGVLVLGATNRPRTLDAALLRPGRFDRVIYVPPPDELGRKAIFSMEYKKWHDALLAYPSPNGAPQISTGTELRTNGIEKPFNVDILASDQVSGSMTGAEIVGACRETAVQVMRTLMNGNTKITGSLLQSLMEELEACLRSKTPLLSNSRVLEEYTKFEDERK